MMLNEALWALLLGNDYVLWHSNVRLVSDPYAFGDSWAAGAGKTQWQPVGGEITDYDPDKPGHVKRVRSPKGQFPPNPHMGESGAFAGAWLVGQITAVESGYADSNKPEKGSLGSAALSRYGTANAGQANIVRIYAARKPLCIYGEGRDGAAVIFQNVYCGLTDRTDVMVETRSGPKRFSVVGNDLHVFYVD
jgi:hypothetical protein